MKPPEWHPAVLLRIKMTEHILGNGRFHGRVIFTVMARVSQAGGKGKD
jgi:hypothetical protein